MIGKIVITPLSSTKTTYTAIGYIRFYDPDGNEIDVMGSSIITNTLNEFETDIVDITTTDTYRNGDYYNVGNAYRNDRTVTEYDYWLSSKDNLTHTIIFKNGVSAISKISYNVTPSQDYTNRSVTETFYIKAYDESGNLIISYTIVPDDSVNNKIYYLETPELSYKYYAFFIDNDTAYNLDSSGALAQVCAVSDLTTDIFTSKGILLPLKNVDGSIFDNKEYQVALYCTNNAATKLNMIASTIPQTAVSNTVSLDMFESVSQLSVSATADNNSYIKTLLSNDGSTWYYYDSTQKKMISTTLDDISTNGNDYSDLINIDSVVLNDFVSTNKKMAIAFYLYQDTYTDTVKITEIQMTGSSVPTYNAITPTLTTSSNSISITLSAGDYILNYI